MVAWYEICSLSAIGKWSSQDCDVVSNLVDEIAIYNFDLFHSTLLYVGAHYTRKNSEAVIHKILSHICLMHNSSQPGQLDQIALCPLDFDITRPFTLRP